MIQSLVPALFIANVAAYLDSKYFITLDAQNIFAALKTKLQYQKLINIKKKDSQSYASEYEVLEQSAKNFGNKDALVFQGRTWSYQQLINHVDRVADWYTSIGVKYKDIVAIFMTNCPEMYLSMLALLKIGACGALVNANLAGEPLLHCIKISKATRVICIASTLPSLQTIKGIEVHVLGMGSWVNCEMPYPYTDIDSLPKASEFTVRPPVQMDDLAFFIYTSGTTGVPKAVPVKHNILRFLAFASNNSGIFNSNDRIYCPLPLFHATALFLGMISAISTGATFILAPKFSARNTFKECREVHANILMHVGELCRYLVNLPPSPEDRNHGIRRLYGNGLNKYVWIQMRERFGIQNIDEVYAMSEGSFFMINRNKGPHGIGSCGHFGFLIRNVVKFCVLVKHDPVSEELIRDPRTGLCVPVAPGEPGEILVKFIDEKLKRPYYGNEKAYEQKYVHNVLKNGDRWFRMGDLLKYDEDGYYYFLDRVGDTFRWKGENVSTTEIQNHLAGFPGIVESVVYGVPLANYEGQAGMATLVLAPETGEQFVLKSLVNWLKEKGVPNYALPRFIRVTDE
ncbi:uncharacterized protein VTP21DRAFT_11337 [Calcarisporiella thermophila]|uniref:uncharacterized protein n=1 Tax=Calcarisporiella thermophila TaxID=911321 RepID=UPI0037424143